MPKLSLTLPVVAVLCTVAAYILAGGFSWLMVVMFFGTTLFCAIALFLVSLVRSRNRGKTSEVSRVPPGGKDMSNRDI